MEFDPKEEMIIAAGNSGRIYYIKMFTYETKHVEMVNIILIFRLLTH